MIKGIQEVRRLPRLGMIRLGIKKVSESSGKEYPAAIDHFNLKDVPEVAAVYGDTPKELDIVFPVENQDVFFHQARRAYGSSQVFCGCDDGEVATRINVGGGKDPEGDKFIAEQGLKVAIGKTFQLPCTGPDCAFTKNKMCKGIGRLMFMLPRVPRFGCYQIATTSFHSMVGLNSYIDAIVNVAGRISQIPLKLKLIPKSIAPEGKKKTVWVLELVYEGTTAQLAEYRKSGASLPALPSEALPSKAELDAEPATDLIPEGGEFVDREMLGKEAPAPAPRDPAEPLPAAAAAAALAPTKPAERKPTRRI